MIMFRPICQSPADSQIAMHNLQNYPEICRNWKSCQPNYFHKMSINMAGILQSEILTKVISVNIFHLRGTSQFLQNFMICRVQGAESNGEGLRFVR